MNKGMGSPRHRASFNIGYIVGDPFFLTTTSIALVLPLGPQVTVDWLANRIRRIDCIERRK
jgi:hypothetical protein